MKPFRYLLISALLLSPGLHAQDKSHLDIPLSNPGKAGVLQLKLIRGGIRVEGYDGTSVQVDAAPGRDDDDDRSEKPNTNGMRRLTPKPDLAVKEENNRVTVGTNSTFRNVDFTIRVPRRFDLQLSTVNGGDIEVEGVTGELEITNVNGSIRLQQISGSAVATTVNGEVKATFKSITGNTPMSFTTLNGDVDITLPGTLKAGVKLQSERGDIYTDFDINTVKNPGTTEKATDGNLTRLRVDNWVQGTISGGGPEFRLKTMNGDIFLRKTK